MTEIDDSPCRGCGGPVELVWKDQVRAGAIGKKQFRTCPNPDCRLKKPGQRRQGDRV